MMCLPLAVLLLAQVTHPLRTAHVTSPPSLVDRLDELYKKLERLTVEPNLISPTPNPLSDEDEELLSAMQTWGNLTPDQLNEVAKDMLMREDVEDDRTERLSDLEYADMMADDNEEEYVDVEYHNDGKEDEDDEDMDKFSDVNRGDMSADPSTASNEEPRVVEDSKHYTSFSEEDIETSSSAPQRPNVTPLAFTKIEAYKTIISAVDHIAATNERPRILYDMPLTPLGRNMLREAAKQNMRLVLHEGQCRLPQPRWLPVRQLVPSASTMFMPPFVQLHRCAPDSGCCVNENMNEDMVCAPIDGQYVKIPFNLLKAEKVLVARMMFYNHTRCGCVDRKTLQATVTVKPSVMRHSAAGWEERQNDWRSPSPTQAPPAESPEEEDVTAPPQLRRCTCPAFFLANITDSGSCTCACDWRDASHRRECQLFSRGREHLGLRDRVCIAAGKCAPPVCDFGAYEREVGKCPFRVRRIRYHVKRHQQEKNIV